MTPLVSIAVAFASALVDGQFEHAHSMLAPQLQEELSPDELRAKLYAMFRGYADGEPTGIWYDEAFADTSWPAMQPDDIGRMHVAIYGEEFNEAISVKVVSVNGQPAIGDILWGRP